MNEQRYDDWEWQKTRARATAVITAVATLTLLAVHFVGGACSYAWQETRAWYAEVRREAEQQEAARTAARRKAEEKRRREEEHWRAYSQRLEEARRMPPIQIR